MTPSATDAAATGASRAAPNAARADPARGAGAAVGAMASCRLETRDRRPRRRGSGGAAMGAFIGSAVDQTVSVARRRRASLHRARRPPRGLRGANIHVLDLPGTLESRAGPTTPARSTGHAYIFGWCKGTKWFGTESTMCSVSTVRAEPDGRVVLRTMTCAPIHEHQIGWTVNSVDE